MSSTKAAPDQQQSAGTVQKSQGTIGLWGLIFLNITAIISLNNLPSEAEYGLSAVFYYLFAAVFFLVPVALVAAELATGWPKQGGVFRWVGEAFKGRFGFMAMFLAFVEVCVFLPTALTFGAVALANIDPNHKSAMSLANNKFFVMAIVLIVYWGALFVTLIGSKGVQKMAKWGGILGVFVPMGILIGFGAAYMIGGNKAEMKLGWDELIPDFSNFSNIVLAASVFLMFAGMEMNAVHIKQVKNSEKTYPKAIFLSAIIVVLIFVLGTLIIAWVVPHKDISLTTAILTTYFDIFEWAHVPWLGSVIAIMLAIGVLVNVTTWVAGPSTGMLAVAKAGYLPRWLQKTNKNGQPISILLIQSGLVSLLAILFVVLPSVQSAYQILNQLANILYLTVYMLMFAAAIYLRHSEPDVRRPFRLGKKGNGLMWFVAGLGFVASLIAFCFSFIPPDQINVGSPVLYVVILVALALLFYAIPNIIYSMKKPEWVAADEDFEPFDWQIKEQQAKEKATATTTSAPTTK
ncbi:putative glutamine/gamma-aminobutyrate antiporter GadC [Actinomycetaceae bacterium MB13-C1-2]|nr:putative glutamine/gamma-aminobutyrate antiporter GadC [Actinomycetaceae bacterium MB13-C1-2]